MKKLLFIFLPLFTIGQTYTVTDRNIGSPTWGESRQYEVQENQKFGKINNNLNYESIGKASSPAPVDYGAAFNQGFNNAFNNSQNNSPRLTKAQIEEISKARLKKRDESMRVDVIVPFDSKNLKKYEWIHFLGKGKKPKEFISDVKNETIGEFYWIANKYQKGVYENKELKVKSLEEEGIDIDKILVFKITNYSILNNETYDRFYKLTLIDYISDKIIYESNNFNSRGTAFNYILEELSGNKEFTESVFYKKKGEYNYDFFYNRKENAIEEIKSLKEFLDLEIITKEEYLKKIKPLKEIILAD